MLACFLESCVIITAQAEFLSSLHAFKKIKERETQLCKGNVACQKKQSREEVPALILTKQKPEYGPGPSTSQQETVALAVSLCCLKLLPYENILAEIHVIKPY